MAKLLEEDDVEVNRRIGTRLKAYRQMNDMSVDQMARVLGFNHRKSVYKVENGGQRVTAAMVVRICKKLNMKSSDLLGL